MWTELLGSATNVVRFPIERRARPTLELMRRLAPGTDDLTALATLPHLRHPACSVRERADAAAAGHISAGDVNGVPLPPDALDGLLAPAVAEAVSLCWSACDATAAMVEAQRELSRARRAGDGSLDRLRARAAALAQRRAELLIEAHARVEAAEGVARAVAFARRGELWVPHCRIDPVSGSAEVFQEPGYKAVVRARLAPDRPRRAAAADRTIRPGSQEGRGRPEAA